MKLDVNMKIWLIDINISEELGFQPEDGCSTLL
jgi:hypothetical protein